MPGNPDKMHEKSLANLRPWTREGAQKGQKKSVEVRMANKAAREALKMSLKEWNKVKEEVDEFPAALDVLRVAMSKALQAENMDEATRLAAIVAEYEQPKLQRQDITQVNKTSELTDDELDRELEKLGLNREGLSLQ